MIFKKKNWKTNFSLQTIHRTNKCLGRSNNTQIMYFYVIIKRKDEFNSKSDEWKKWIGWDFIWWNNNGKNDDKKYEILKIQKKITVLKINSY